MSSTNGKNGDSKDHRTAVEAVEAQISEHLAEDEASVSSVGLSDPPDTADPLQEWKKRVSGSPVSLEDVHTGLLAVAQYAEAAIVYGVNISADLHKIMPVVAANAHQINILAAKVETANTFSNQLDEEFAETTKIVRALRKDVQFMKDDLAEIKVVTAAIPAIKEMLGEILARLPDPKST